MGGSNVLVFNVLQGLIYAKWLDLFVSDEV